MESSAKWLIGPFLVWLLGIQACISFTGNLPPDWCLALPWIVIGSVFLILATIVKGLDIYHGGRGTGDDSTSRRSTSSRGIRSR